MSEVATRVQCPQCLDTGSDNLIVYADGSTYCFACSYTSPATAIPPNSGELKSLTKLLTGGQCVPLLKRGITYDTCAQYNITVNSYKGVSVCVFPFYKDGVEVAQKLKTIDKQIWWLGSPKGVDMFGSPTFNKATKRLIVTEGEEDALAVAQVVGGATHVTTLTSGSGSALKFAKDHYRRLLEYSEVVLCFDMDEAGQLAAAEFAAYFPVGKISIAKISEKDACEMLLKGKHNELKWAVIQADLQIPEGVLKIGDLTPDYFNNKFEQGVRTQFPILNYHLGGLRKGELTMLTSGTGMGKSTLCTNIVYNLVVAKGMTICDIKLEESQQVSIYHYLAMHNNISPRKVRENPDLLSTKQKEEFIHDFRNLYIHNHFGSLDSNSLINTLDYYATVVKADFIFLDHISMAISGQESSRDGERKDIDKLLTKIRELVHRTGVGFLCVSHLRNPPNGDAQWEEGRPIRRSDLRGSGSLSQLSDNIIAIEGNLREEEVKNIRKLKLIKTRYGDVQEQYCDNFSYDLQSGRVNDFNT